MTVRRIHLRLALAALAVAVLYNVWHFALRGRAPSGAAAAREAAEAPLIVTPSVAAGPGAAAPPDPLTMPAPPRVDPAARVSFARDPFLFGDESRLVVAAEAPRAPAALPSVRSVLFSASRRLAMVDGRIVGIGEAAGGYTVADIERDAVVFEAADGSRVRVPLHGPAERAPLR